MTHGVGRLPLCVPVLLGWPQVGTGLGLRLRGLLPEGPLEPQSDSRRGLLPTAGHCPVGAVGCEFEEQLLSLLSKVISAVG